MKYAFAAIAACLLIAAGILFRDVFAPRTVDEAAPPAESGGAAPAVVEPVLAIADCLEPERNTAPHLQVSIACEGLRCRFDASATTDDRGVRAWRWTFGQDVKSEATTPYDFPADGQYEVGIGVIDACGLADYRTITVDLAAGESFSCVSCLAPPSTGTSIFPRRNRAQGATPGSRHDGGRFSGRVSRPSPDMDTADGQQTSE